MIISMYFKEVYTTNIKYYNIDTSWTPMQLYVNIKVLISSDFNINNFELVDIIHDSNIIGKPEEKPKLDIFENKTLYDIYTDKINQLGFYIKPL